MFAVPILLTAGLTVPHGPAVVCNRRQVLAVASGTFAALGAAPALAAQKLSFTEYPSGLRLADVSIGSGEMPVDGSSRVTFHVFGRLVGKNGWIFMNTQEDDEPLRLTCGRGMMIEGLEEGLMGMRAGGKRRLVIPSRIGYNDRDHEPKPRTFGQRQRLYGTVLNDVRRRQERQSVELGGSDVAGVVALDVQMLNVRPPTP